MTEENRGRDKERANLAEDKARNKWLKQIRKTDKSLKRVRYY
jgi:hypothetical protein